MYALVDCNNFYCSCERLFNPLLENKPIIVLSNNDGCAISRSDEAKVLGVVMGTPGHMIKELIKEHDIKVFSSNYTLYGDMSDRVMKTMGRFVPRMEIYSIDEAFLDMHELGNNNLLELGMIIKTTVKRDTGIPVTIGIAPTKTLAKMANRYAKKRRKDPGVFWAANEKLVREMLESTEVNEIWGIGPQHSLFLRKHGFKTALDLTRAPEEWIRSNLSVVGQRLFNEIKGIPTIKWEFETPTKKNITTSRSFGKLLSDKTIILEAICNHAAACALKLRQQKTCCKTIEVFIQTNVHKPTDLQYARSINLELETATNHTSEIIKCATRGFEIIFKEGYRYMKCGIIVKDFVPEENIQQSLFNGADRKKEKSMLKVLDCINKSLGKEVVRFAVQGYEKKYRLKAEMLSPCYTTRLNDIIKIRN